MSNEVINTLILSVFLAASVGTGYYFTKKKQPARLAEVASEIEAIENRSAELETLLADEALASDAAAQTLAQWNTRYKVLPTELSSPDVVAYLNALSARGFQRFDISLTGLTPGSEASFYTYQVTGEAYFESLYAFIWHLENSRGLYRMRGLSIKKQISEIPNPATDIPRQVVLAQFNFMVDAYFSGNPDLSAPDSAIVPPPSAFPPRRTPINPFFPYIFAQLPPNSDDRVDIETDSLLSVIGGTAVFERDGELRQLRAGDRVYLGRISNVDPARARVTVDLNKGGIRETVRLDLQTGERYRQHVGGTTLIGRTTKLPAGPTLETAPPAPGTPEAAGSTLYRGLQPGQVGSVENPTGEASASDAAEERPAVTPERAREIEAQLEILRQRIEAEERARSAPQPASPPRPYQPVPIGG